MKALSYSKVDISSQNRQNSNWINRFFKATALAISTLLPINANALVDKQEQKPAATINLEGSLRVWNSVWRSHKYYYAKKGKKWNSASRVTSGVLGYYGLYGMKAAKIDADGCVSCSGVIISPKKLSELETERLGLELVGIEIAQNTQPVHNPIKDERLVLFLTHGEEKKHEIEAALALLEHGFSHHLNGSVALHSSSDHHDHGLEQYALHDYDPGYIAHMDSQGLGPSESHLHMDLDIVTGHGHLAVDNGHDRLHEHDDQQEDHHSGHHGLHYALAHDPLSHIAHMNSGNSHNPFWMIHMYALHVGHQHSAIEHDGEQGDHQEHEEHHNGHHHVFHFFSSDHDPLSHIAHMNSGNSHNPFWMIHMYALHHGGNHTSVEHETNHAGQTSHGQHNIGPGNHTKHVAETDTHNIPIDLMFDLRQVKRAPLTVAAALPPLE